MTKPNCDSSVELTAFSVIGNKVVNLYGNDSPIDANGHASMNMSYGPMTVNFSFISSGRRNSVSGAWSSRGCSGTFRS